MPHVTTKEMGEKLPDGAQATYIQRHAVYCRYSAKSDLATASQYTRIIAQRTEMLRSEMLRRVKEVNIPNLVSSRISGFDQKTVLRVSHGDDKAAQTIRITRDPAVTSGVVMHEELSDGLFEEINNVLATNRLLAVGERDFVFGDDIYYRVYAERQHVQFSDETYKLLSKTALERVYGPFLFWLLRLGPNEIAELIHSVLEHSRSTHVRLVCRLAMLLGRGASDWLMTKLEEQWRSHPQPPSHFFSFKKMLKLSGTSDPRLVALQQSGTSNIELTSAHIPIQEFLENSKKAASFLSKACVEVFQGNLAMRGTCRQLDVLAYGSEFVKLGDSVTKELRAS